MPSPRDPHPVLVITTSNGRMDHPIHPGADLARIIAGLAPFIPSATWHVQPTNTSKVDQATADQGATP